MTSSFLKSALVAVAGFALCAPVALQAQTDTTNPIATAPVKNPTPATASTTKSKMAKTPYKGTVKSIDASSIVVTTSKGDMTFAVSSATKVKVDKKMAKVTDVTVGEMVTGSFTKDDTGAMTACSIHAKTK